MSNEVKAALIGAVAVIIAALIALLPPTPSSPIDPPESAVEFEAVDSPLPSLQDAQYDNVTVFLGTHKTEEGAGTDSDVAVELFNETQQLSSKIFYGGRGGDLILEKGSPTSQQTFDFSGTLLPNRAKLTLITPRGNGGHWLGTSAQFSFQTNNGEVKTLCATEEIGWLVDGRNKKELNLGSC